MLKKPLKYKEQVKKMIEHGMIIDDEALAEELLSTNNYYRITGYALQFRKAPNNSDYRKGTSLKKVYNIYKFDEALP